MDWLGISALSDPLLLALRKPFRAMMASSCDRRGGNHDWSNYLRREGRATVMMEADGPGCITRFWVADPQKGTVRIWIDGEVAIECPLPKLFDMLPLSFGIGGESPENYARSKAERVPMGHTSYCPIPFAKSCKVTIEPEDDYLYYHINHVALPPATKVESFNLERASNSESVRAAQQVLSAWQSGFASTASSWSHESFKSYSARLALDPGAEATLFQAEGFGVVRSARIKLHHTGGRRQLEHLRDHLWLIAHFDDDEPRDPSIRAPMGAFFLDYGQDPTPRSLFLGTDDEGYYCHFAMPHFERATIKLVNRGVLPVRFEATILHERSTLNDLMPNDPTPNAFFRFRATYHIESPFGPDHRDYDGLACRLLNIDGRDNVELLLVPQGAGHFVGCGFHVDLRDAPTDRASGEGDEMFFLDDDPRLSHYGTGLEDYVNDAWGIRGYMGPLSGDAVGGEWGTDPQIFGYRLHVPDPIPFVHKGRFTLEHGTGNNCSGLYRSVAYWYMDPSLTRTRHEEWRWNDIRTGKRKMNEDEDG